MSATSRVAVVDDSGTMRTMLARLLGGVPDLSLVGSYSSADEMFASLPRDRPDVVTLDVEMPGMDGMAALRRLRAEHPSVSVVMCSSLTSSGRAQTIAALVAGAFGAVCKPTAPGELTVFKDELIHQIRGARGGRSLAAIAENPVVAKRTVATVRRKAVTDPRLIVMGASTGGPNALADIFAKLPHDFSVPILLVQHLPFGFTEEFAARLRRAGPLPVTIAAEGAPIGPGITLAATGVHLGVRLDNGLLTAFLSSEAPRQGCRPSVDVLFSSAATAIPTKTVGIILTGMGRDGADGARMLYDAGGNIWAQDEQTSVVWGMPGAIANDGVADAVLPLPGIVERLQRFSRGARR